MNRDRIAGRLQQLAGRLQQRWGMLTADASHEAAGWHAQISGLARERRGLSCEYAERQLGEFIKRHRNWNN